jgi:tripartite ATP-independent transporter DctM subunit
LATVVACAGFGAMTGSSMATSLTIGHAAYPEMRRYGYSEELSTGSIAAGGTLGAIVPPSGVLVLYAILTEVSVGALFIAAAIPAIIVILLFIFTVMIQVRLQPTAAPAATPRQPGALIAAIKGIWPSLGLIVVVLGGIYAGVFTVTEAASVGALGTFALAWARGRLGNGALSKVMIETAERTAMVYALIIGGSIFAFFIGVTQLPVEATIILNKFNLSGLAVVVSALVIYILLGMVMGAYEIMIITVPVIAPILVGFQFDLIWWGIIMVMVVEIGLLTPPFGMNCFIIKAVAADVPLSKVFKGVTPFILAHMVALALLVLFPSLVLWLPGELR